MIPSAAPAPLEPTPGETPVCPRHAAPSTFTCRRCGGFGCAACNVASPWGPICTDCLAILQPPAEAGTFTWEAKEEGRWLALWRTSWSLSSRPKATWPLVPLQTPWGPAIWFAIWNNQLESAWLTIGALGGGAYFALDGEQHGALAAMGIVTLWLVGALAVCLAVGLLGLAVACPTELWMVRWLGGKAELRTVARIWCYSQAPGVLGLLTAPFELGCGIPITALWSRYCRARAYEHFCGLSRGRALWAAFLPFPLVFVPPMIGGMIVGARIARLALGR